MAIANIARYGAEKVSDQETISAARLIAEASRSLSDAIDRGAA
jgi:hypothetical protein